jgi:hypothetical protein
MSKEHHYSATIQWTGNKGEGTTRYDAYERSHTVSINNKPDLQCSSDTPFRSIAPCCYCDRRACGRKSKLLTS